MLEGSEIYTPPNSRLQQGMSFEQAHLLALERNNKELRTCMDQLVHLVERLAVNQPSNNQPNNEMLIMMMVMVWRSWL